MKLGYRFIVEPNGTSLSNDERNQLARLKPAGVMFRAPNFLQGVSYSEWLSAYKNLVDEIRSAIGREKIIFCVDHEGEKIVRFPDPITRFPYAGNYGGDIKVVEAVAKASAIELRSLGINVNFAPVADINSNPKNPVIGKRAFGSDAREVAMAAVTFAKTLLSEGMIPCAKHFPGHGDTETDSHFELPHLMSTKSELQERELIPFVALIESGIPMIMTSHMSVPALDPHFPVTTSLYLNSELLRGELKFSGVIITDALSMKGISQNLNSGSFAVDAHCAGVDLLLYTGPGLTIEGALDLASSLEQAECSDDELSASQLRIENLLQSLPQHQIAQLDSEVLSDHLTLAHSLKLNENSSEYIPKNF